MIDFFSSWAKGIGVTVVVSSIIEMLLPNNNLKKYIRMVLGVYLIFNMVSPLIKNKEIFNINNFDLNEVSVATSTEEVDQTSMNKRIKKLYEQELQKDIIKKLEDQGYEIKACTVITQISTNEKEETKINKIKIDIDYKKDEQNQEESAEKKVIAEIQKIKKVETSINVDNKGVQENKIITKSDIQNIKMFLIDEYGVSENCLEIS